MKIQNQFIVSIIVFFLYAVYVHGAVKKEKKDQKSHSQVNTEFNLAAKAGSLKKLKQAIDEDASIDYVTPRTGCGSIHWLATSGDITAIEVLLKNGADVNQKDDMGRTCLFSVLSNEHVNNLKTFNILIRKHSAILGTKDNKRNTLFHAAAAIGSTFWINTLWATICEKFPEEVASGLLKMENIDHKTALDLAQGQYDFAEKRYQKALDSSSDQSNDHSVINRANKMKKYKTVITTIEQLLHIKPHEENSTQSSSTQSSSTATPAPLTKMNSFAPEDDDGLGSASKDDR